MDVSEKLEVLFVEVIQQVAVGKKGSRDLSPLQIDNLYRKLSLGKFDLLHQVILFTALTWKKFSHDEKKLQEFSPFTHTNNRKDLINFLEGFVPNQEYDIVSTLFANNYLMESEAYHLGRFLFNHADYNDMYANSLRCIATIILRMRYTTLDEYFGLYKSLSETMSLPSNLNHLSHQKNIIQFSEPFDGVNRSIVLGPLLANLLIQKGYTPFCLTGQSSGPKEGINLLTLYQALEERLDTNRKKTFSSEYGYYVNLAEVSQAWLYWVNLRRTLIKRPFMATLERFLYIVPVKIHIMSAFHSNFVDIMLDLGERIGYPGIIVLKRGREGSLTLPLSKEAYVFCSVRQSDNSYKRNTLTCSVKDLGEDFQPDTRVESDVEEYVTNIMSYIQKNTTNSAKHDLQIHLTWQSIFRGIQWIEQYLPN